MASTVLIVDDSESTLELLEAYLLKLDLQVIRTVLPEEALHLAKTKQPDLIICDMIMPGLDGTKIFEIIRSDKEIPYIPFMLMTAFRHRDIEKHCYSYGIDDFILKPIEKADLHARVSKILSMTKDFRASSKGKASISGNIQLPMDNDFINHIQNILMLGRTGYFDISHENESDGKIWIIENQIQNAKFANHTGTEALKAILSLKSGKYSFIEGDFGVVEQKIKDSSMDLILHLCQDIDESNLN